MSQRSQEGRFERAVAMTANDALQAAQRAQIAVDETVESLGGIVQEIGLATEPDEELRDWIELAEQLSRQTRELLSALKTVRTLRKKVRP